MIRAVSRSPLWLILLLAFAARFAVGVANDGVLYPDELMQYLEQAHRLAFGAGMTPWEYEYGVRSWVPALALAAVMKTTQFVGADTPAVYQPLIKAILSAASLVLPYSVYRLGRTLLDEPAARLALVFTAFWYELVSYGHRATIDALAAYTAFATLALVFADSRRRVAVAAGALAGLTFILRFQLSPLLGVLGLLALWRWRARAWPAAAAALVVIVLGGALDYYTWGVWFSPIVTNLRLQTWNELASIFGTKPVYWYPPVMVVLSGGLAAVGAAGLVLARRSCWPLIVLGAVTLVAFSLIGHKETRFVLTLTPVWLIGLAALVANRGRLIATALPRARRLAPVASGLLLAGFAIVSVLGLSDRLPFETRVLRPNIARNVARDAYRALAADDDVIAVLDASGSDGWYLAPYYDLHHDVPLYWPLSDGYRIARADPARYASHVLTAAAASGPAGFRRLKQIGDLVIWRRMVDPVSTDQPLEYEPRITALQPVRSPPTVTPRW